MESEIPRMLDRFKNTPGLAMPPLQMYAAYLALRQPPYNTGLFADLDGQASIRLDDLMARSIGAAQAYGLTVHEDFEHETGCLILDVPQVASILASALGDLSRRYGEGHRDAIAKWAHATFGPSLPLLDDENKQAGIAYLSDMSGESQIVDLWAFMQAQEGCVKQLKASHIVNTVDFLILRAQALLSMYCPAQAI